MTVWFLNKPLCTLQWQANACLLNKEGVKEICSADLNLEKKKTEQNFETRGVLKTFSSIQEEYLHLRN